MEPESLSHGRAASEPLGTKSPDFCGTFFYFEYLQNANTAAETSFVSFQF